MFNPAIVADRSVRLMSHKYIDGPLAKKIGLSKQIKGQTFLTIPIYVHLYVQQWAHDSHEYKHEGSRVDAATLVNSHCYTSARLREVCGALYKVNLRSRKEKEAAILILR